MGSLFGYFNDSLFWVVNLHDGDLRRQQQMIVWSIPTTIAWAIGGTGVALLNLLFGPAAPGSTPCCRCWCWPSRLVRHGQSLAPAAGAVLSRGVITRAVTATL